MKILFDQGTPVPLRRHLHPHVVDTTAECGWSTLLNGELIARAEQDRYQAIVTTDQNLKYQQNLRDRTIRILVLQSTSWPRISKRIVAIREALDNLPVGGYAEVDV